MTGALSPGRAALLVSIVALSAFANSAFNDFAYDDDAIVVQHPVVTEGRALDAFSSPYWPEVVSGSGLYRPVTLASFALEWGLWNGNPAGFHVVNILVHAAVSLMVFFLVLAVSAPIPALVGGALFAAHPVHTEAVANVVGRAELYSALFVLGACLLFWNQEGLSRSWRIVRLLGIGTLFVLGLGSKEMAATLPALLVLLALVRSHEVRVIDRVRAEAPVFLLTAALLIAFLGARFLVVGFSGGRRSRGVPAGRLDGPEDPYVTGGLARIRSPPLVPARSRGGLRARGVIPGVDLGRGCDVRPIGDSWCGSVSRLLLAQGTDGVPRHPLLRHRDFAGHEPDHSHRCVVGRTNFVPPVGGARLRGGWSGVLDDTRAAGVAAGVLDGRRSGVWGLHGADRAQKPLMDEQFHGDDDTGGRTSRVVQGDLGSGARFVRRRGVRGDGCLL
jgi:hypothetical protein